MVLELFRDLFASREPLHVESNAVAAVQRGDLDTAAEAVRTAVETLAVNPTPEQSEYTQHLAQVVGDASQTVPNGD